MNTTTKRQQFDTSEAMAVFSDLFAQGIQLSRDFLEALSSSSFSSVEQLMSSSTLRDLGSRLGTFKASRTCSSCEIPPPCWAPQPLGEVTCHVCPGGTASIRFRITNCGVSSRNINVDASGAANVKIEPPNLVLGPMQRGFVTASASVPAEAASGQEYEYLLWVHGCRDHYLRWTLKVASRGASCCHEVDVEDCPDLIHHWYDHFYCDRPCVN
jgi:hypothetical protein